jgi:hypothetical protein
MLFEVAPEATARKLAESLFGAEAGDLNAWRYLDDDALYRLRTDADVLATLVPWALLRLSVQLIAHPRASVRLDVIRLLGMVCRADLTLVDAALARLGADPSRGVQRAADNLRLRLMGG